jgi:hypothetical protein
MPTAATQRWSRKKVVETVQGPSFGHYLRQALEPKF